jgi:ribosome-associated translation inhibitor RaiA
MIKMDQAKLQLDMENKRANIGVQENRLEAENIKGSANIALKVAELQAKEEQADIQSAIDIANEITDRD